MGPAFTERGNLIGAAHPEMEALVADLGETVNLAVLHSTAPRMFTHLGASAPLHGSGVGKALLAWRAGGDPRQNLGDGPYPAYTPHSITTRAALLNDLARVRAQGHALDNEEREPDVRCVAVPVWGGSGQVLAALSVSAPTARLDPGQTQAFAGRRPVPPPGWAGGGARQARCRCPATDLITAEAAGGAGWSSVRPGRTGAPIAFAGGAGNARTNPPQPHLLSERA